MTNDVETMERFTAPEIRDLVLESTHVNLLAMIFFVARYADENARARCTFVTFPASRSPG